MAHTLEASQQALAQLRAMLAASESDARPQRRCTHSLQSSMDAPGAVVRAELPRRHDACRAELNRVTGRSLHASAQAAVAAAKAAAPRAPSPDDALVDRRLKQTAVQGCGIFREGGKLQSALF